MLEVNATIQIPDEEFEWTFARSGGPGGQNVNKVSSKAVLRWGFDKTTTVPEVIKGRFRTQFAARVTTEGEVVISSQRYRDQERNKQDCLEKLAEMLRAAAFVPTPRRATKPTKSSQRRRVADKKITSARKATRKKPASDD